MYVRMGDTYWLLDLLGHLMGCCGGEPVSYAAITVAMPIQEYLFAGEDMFIYFEQSGSTLCIILLT